MSCTHENRFRFIESYLGAVLQKNIFFSVMSRKRKELTDAELEDIIQHMYDSTDDFEECSDFSDSDSIADPDYTPDDDDDQNERRGVAWDEREESADDVESLGEHVDTVTDQPSTSATNKTSSMKKTKAKDIVWHKKNLQIDEDALSFKGNSDLPTEILQLETPFDFFKYYITDSLIKNIAEQTNLYSVQKNPNKPSNISSVEIQKFLGIIVYMSINNPPRTRCLWRHDIGIPNVRNAMTINDFERLKGIIHFNDNSTILPKEDPKFDILHKLRPLLTELNNRFSSVPMTSKLSVDEQICATKCRHQLKQYNPMKPHKWGFKLFMLCDITGLSYNFEIYTGATNWFTRLAQGESDLGASANIVVRLARNIPRNRNYQLYCDNYYTSLELFAALTNQGIYMLGTIRQNRIPNNPLRPEKSFKKEARGSCEEFVTNLHGTELSLVSWNDNKVVKLLSSCFGKLPTQFVKRFDRTRKQKVDVTCPTIVKEYNKHMGGVDLLDSHIGRYRIPLRSKKWYLRIFFHLVDVAIINAFLLYQRAKKETNVPSRMTQWEFRLQIAETLCLIGTSTEKKRGRPSSSQLEHEIEAKRQRGPTAHLPTKNVRLDEFAHWIKYEKTRQRCKLPTCKGFSHYKCQKCGVHLCLTKDKNCFHDFHVN